MHLCLDVFSNTYFMRENFYVRRRNCSNWQTIFFYLKNSFKPRIWITFTILGCKENGFSGLHSGKLLLRCTSIARFKKFVFYSICPIFIPKKLHLLRGQMEPPLSDFFELALDTRTRANHPFNLFVKSAKVNPYKYSFFVRIVKDWNNLPLHVVEAESLETFKTRLKSFLNL